MLRPDLWTQEGQRQYDWFYEKPPQQAIDGISVSRDIPAWMGKRGASEPLSLEGKVLRTKRIGLPDALAGESSVLKLTQAGKGVLNARALMAKIKKTILHLEFAEPLEPGEQGWMRLVVEPHRREEYATPWPKHIPAMDEPYRFEQWRVTTCPVVIREMLDKILRGRDVRWQEDNEPIDPAAAEMLSDIILNNGVNIAGTNTRIADCRIAIIPCNGVDIYEVNAFGKVDPYNLVPDIWEKTARFGLLFGGGSDCCLEADLDHNIGRILDVTVHGILP